MGEVMRDTDSQRDSISLVTLELDPSTNEGTGEMVFGAEFKVNQKTGQLDIETMSMNPTKLTNVKPKGSSTRTRTDHESALSEYEKEIGGGGYSRR